MGTRLTVFNQKGGVGKTTTVLNLGAALARRGAVPLLVDLDAQSHLSSILNPGASSGERLFAYFNVGKQIGEVSRALRLRGVCHASRQVMGACGTQYIQMRRVPECI